jgi:glutathione-specific gamma-glutamylcyclotransferase
VWVFGYGSLIWDKSWLARLGCRRREIAELRGYRRVFNKASTTNWGTRASPCPTLNVEAVRDGSCVGMAFEFDDGKRNDVLACLGKREGPGFELREGVQVWINGRAENTLLPICVDDTLLIHKSLEDRAGMARVARGTKGTGVQYVKGVLDALADRHLEDPVVTEFWAAVTGTP